MTDAKFPEGRKLLALYPVLLFYLSLAWMVLIGFQQGTSGRAMSASPPGAISAPVIPGDLAATQPTASNVVGANATRFFL
jgi:hypothetical protein